MTSVLSYPLFWDPVTGLGLLAFFCLLITLPFSFWRLGSDVSSKVPTTLVSFANFALTFQLLFRWWESGHFPISNLYESLCFLTWACTLFQLLLQKAWPSPIVSAASTPVSLIIIAFASFALPEDLKIASPLVPALRSSWLVMHVSVIMCSYAALIVGSLLSFAVLITDRDEVLQLRSSSIGIGGFKNKLIKSEAWDENDDFNINPFNINKAEQLDALSYRSITVGFLLLTLGLISGAVWANEAWGSWWSWDPKETWAFICWLVYAAYLHIRLVRGWQGRKPAIVAIAGIFVILICYLGVNYWLCIKALKIIEILKVMCGAF